MSKQYIGSQEHWEDSVNADYDRREQEAAEQQKEIDRQMGEQAYPLTTKQEDTFWESKLYKQLKHIYDCYSDEWTNHNEKETADLLHDYQTRNIP